MRTMVAHATTWFVSFALVVIMVFLTVLGWQLDRRTDSIESINQSAQRIESAAVHTEQVLLELVEARRTPEAIAQQQQIRQAVSQIRQIHSLLCSAPDLAEAAECDG